MLQRRVKQEMLTKKTVSLILLLVFIIFAYHHRGARDRITSLSEKINKNLPNFVPKQSYFAKFTEETFFKYLGLTGFNEYLIRLTPYEAAILKKTLDFMVEKRDPEDPELVAFVKTLITPPFQKSQRKLSDPKKLTGVKSAKVDILMRRSEQRHADSTWKQVVTTAKPIQIACSSSWSETGMGSLSKLSNLFTSRSFKKGGIAML